jgi:ketosteroid isomerase-like protein
MDESPIARLLEAVDRLDAEAAAALFAPDARLRTADGREADGSEAVRALLTAFLGSLRSASYRITGQWHDGDVWIAEVEGTYELRDGMQTDPLLRVLVVRRRPDGIADVRVYGAHERELADHPTGEEGMWVSGRWIPPL